MASILTTTKKILGLEELYTAFDLDVTTHVNTAFSVLSDLGVGPEEGFFIEDATAEWEDLTIPADQLNMVKTYIYLKVRFLFDPPGTSFLLEAMSNQIKELEWRLNMKREVLIPVPAPEEEDP